MHIERVLIINKGWQILTTQKSEQWDEALTVLDAMDDQMLSDAARDSGGHSRDIEIFYTFLCYFYNNFISSHYEWNDYKNNHTARIATYSEAPPIKNKVLASFMGLDEISGGEFISSIYLQVPYYFTSEIIDVAVYFTPTAAAMTYFREIGTKSDSSRVPTEEFCKAELAKFKALNSQAPVVLAFFSPTAPAEVVVEEVASIKTSAPAIERTIEFAPEYYQAGVGLLSYFGEVLRQKDPNTKSKVRIEQDGNTVRLHIESPSGEIETVERELEKFALVISNQAPPESLFENRIHIMQLESKLAITQVELKNALDTKQLMDGIYSHQIRDLRQDVSDLKQQIATQLLHQGQFINLVAKQNDSHERLQTGMLSHAQGLFKSLLEDAQGNQLLLDAITSLRHNLMDGIATIEVEEQIKEALATVKQTKPGFLPRILTELESAGYKAAASSAVGAAVAWLAQNG